MINAIERKVPESHQPPLKIPISEDFIGVDLLIRDELVQLALLEFHLLFEIIFIDVCHLAPVETGVLALARTLLGLVRVAKEVIFLLVDVVVHMLL